MMSKNKNSEIVKSVPRYGFRKLTVGLAGVALTTALALANPNTSEVKADTIPDDPDAVNTQPSGAKAAQAELNAPVKAAPAAKTATPAPQTPTKTAAQHAAATLSAQTAKVRPKDQVPDDPTVAQKQTVHQSTSNNAQATQASQNNANAANQTAVSQGNAQTNNSSSIAKQSTITDTNRTPNITKTALPKTRQANLTNGNIPDITSDKDTKNIVGNTSSDSINTRANESDATDPAHNKYVKRTITWVVKQKDGSKKTITYVQQTARFGQLWEDSGNGKVYTPWESDPRTAKFDAYTNADMLKALQAQVTGGTLTQEAYDSVVAMFNGKDYTVSSDGAPISDPVGPLSSDLDYTVTLTPKDAAKNVKVTIVYRDLDDNNKILNSKDYTTTTTDSGSSLDASSDYNATVNDYLSKGYTHNVSDDTLPNGGKISIPASADAQDAYVYYVGLHHKMVEYGPGEKNPFTNKDDDVNLVKNIKQTIHYTGAPNAIPDNVQTIKFTRHGLTDMVTGNTTYKDWDKTTDKYQDVTSPTVSGYVPDQAVVAGTNVNINSNDTVKTVTYAPEDQMRDAIVHYRYDSWDSNKEVFPDKNRKIAATIDNDGNWKYDKDAFNQDIIAKDGYTATVNKTNVQGGKLHAWIVYVKNPANETVIHFIDQDNDNKPIDKVSNVTTNNIIGKPIEKPASVDSILDQLDKLGYEVVSNPFDTPTNAIDGKQDLNYVLKHKKQAVSPVTNRTETVHFVDEQGNKIAPDKTQSASFTHNGVTDLVTGETTWTGWSANQNTNPVDVPVVNGYVAESKQVPSQVLTPDKDIDLTVKYHKMGKIVPVDDNGKVISGADQPIYVNDPTDPTKVKPNQKVPTVPGYTTDTTTVTPTDPTKDTPVKYHQNATPTENTSLGIIVHDDDTNQDLNDYQWSSGTVTPGGKVSYDWAKEKQRLIDHGYVVVQEPLIPDNYSKTAQVITIHVKHGIVHVNPQNPKTPGDKINQGDAKWPETSLYQHDRTYTVHFVDSKGRKLAPDQVQTMHFGRDLQIDAVTGKILNPDAKWTPQYDQYAGIQAAKINGYRFNSKSLAGVSLVKDVLPGPNAVDSDISDSIVYTADDQVPNDPGNGGIDSGKGNNQLGKPNKAPEATPAPTKPATAAPKTTPQAAQKVINHAQVQKASVLPQTGSDTKQSLALILLGLAAITLTTSTGLDKMRKH